jgi:hypothetical protein
MRRAMEIGIFLTVVGCMVASFALGQTSRPMIRVTDLFSADETRRSGLSKLDSAEVDALNSAIVRVMLDLRRREGNKSAPTSHGGAADEDDLDFYDSSGRAVAYASADHELTIYLWSGRPVAYLDKENVYGFNGKHLGWLNQGGVYDHQGNIVAATADRFASPVSAAPLKALKQFEPFKAFEQFAPFKPFLSQTWSTLGAREFFLEGAK